MILLHYIHSQCDVGGLCVGGGEVNEYNRKLWRSKGTEERTQDTIHLIVGQPGQRKFKNFIIS